MKQHPQNEKGHTVDAVQPSDKKQRANSTAKSTSTEAQRIRILAELRASPKTSYDLRRVGCYQAPTRIWELINIFGCQIESDRVTVVDQDGYTHSGVALYSLISAPEQLVRKKVRSLHSEEAAHA
jgi:hypothetical protein